MKISERLRVAKTQKRQASLGHNLVYNQTQKHLGFLSPTKMKATWSAIEKGLRKEANDLLGAYAKYPDTKRQLDITIRGFIQWASDATDRVIQKEFTRAITEKGDLLAETLDKLYSESHEFNRNR
jgi:hypothetical protein